MVVGQHGHFRSPEQIQATVSYVCVIEKTVSDYGEGGERRPHTSQGLILSGLRLNTQVGFMEGAEEKLLRIVRGGGGVDFLDSFDSHTAGELSSLASAHSIGYGH